MNSLRLRLFGFLLALAALAMAAVGGATYFSVRDEADQLFDYQLRQMALSLRDQGRIADADRELLANPEFAEFDYLVQIWSLDGLALYSSLPRTLDGPLPGRTVLGFSTVRVGGADWRVFAAATPLRIVQVGQPLAVREQLARAAAGRSVLPIALAAPLVALALWWLVGISLAPLQRVVAAARARGAGDAASLAPLPAAGLPSELQPLVQSFNQLLQRLGTAFQAQRDFVADAAHELRTPLTALRLQIGLVRDAADAAERETALARLRSGVDRAVHLVEQLLALARAEPGSGAAQAPLDLAEVARQALADAGPLAQSRGGRLTLELPDGPSALPLTGDRQALRSALRNLLDNALLHGGPAPQVTLRVRAARRDNGPDGADGVQVQVDDRGPGIPAAERERVFDRFHRRDPGQAPGSGLGLAIVRAVAQQHGGQVLLQDAPGGGLRVGLWLPRAEAAADATSAAGGLSATG